MTFNPCPKPQKRRKDRKGMARHRMRQKPPRAKSRASQTEIDYMIAVKHLRCCITGESGVIAHHTCHDRRGRGKWNGWSCIPIIPAMHDRHTPEGIHENKGSWEEKYGPDWSYISETLKAIYGDRWSEDH